MKVLHILRSDPDQMVSGFIAELSRDSESERFPLYEDEVDYSQLVTKIFAGDQVICWW